jgi:ferric-dicitrate binding protein FerR (iron transport regulator)
MYEVVKVKMVNRFNLINMDRQIDDYIVNFLARKESPEDVRKLKEWLDADAAHREELKLWIKTWDAAGMADSVRHDRSGEAYERFLFRLKQETPLNRPEAESSKGRIILKAFRRIAAVVVISFSLGMLFHYYWVESEPAETAFIENIVPLGSKSEIKLPDGSTVHLNAGSTLRYTADYGKKRRDIYLEGEGYFNVAKLATKPFTVYTSLMKIKALGTEFNVKSYAGENVVETILIKGEVLVEKSDMNHTSIDHPVLLKPGQKFSLNVHPESVSGKSAEPPPDAALAESPPKLKVKQLAPAIVAAEVSWKERNWRIESEELKNLSVKIERRYDVRIHVDEPLQNYRFTGTVKDESLEQVLNAMQLTAPILFHINGKNVYIHIDPKKIN